MLDLIDHLEPSPKRERDKYICPVCGGHNLSVAKSGKFQCFSSDCDTKEIFKAALAIAGIEGDRTNYDREREQRRLEREQADRERIAQLPSLARRHAEISAKLKQGYTAKHLALLLDRGFTREQIDWHGFYSSFGAIGCVVRSLDRRCVSVLRRMDEKIDGTRYLWLKEFSKLPAESVAPDQLPIAVALPCKQDIEPGVVYVTESSAIKVSLASERLKGLTIGVGGCSGSLDRIRTQIEAIAPQIRAKYGLTTIEWRILPDAGYRVNPGVNSAVNSLIRILSPLGRVMMGDWSQGENKAVGDIDEISQEVLASIAWHEAIEQPPIRPCDLRINQRYLDPSVASLLPRSGIVAIESPKGSGKSKAIAKPIIDSFKSQGKRILSIVPYVGLGTEQCEKFGLMWHEYIGHERGLMQDLTCAVTWDSLAKLTQDYCQSKPFDLVIIDEARTGLNHAHTGNTDLAKGGNRAKALAALQRLCSGAEMVLALDADNLDLEVGYLSKLAPGHPKFIALNEALPEPKSLTFWENRKEVINELLAAASGERIVIFTDSQALGEQLDLTLSEGNPHNKIVRIDRKTSGDPIIREALKDLDGFLSAENATLIYSPTINCGVSIEGDHFDRGFAFSHGVLDAPAFRQGMARYRRDIPWDIYASDANYLTQNPGLTPADVMANLKGKNEFSGDILDLALEAARAKFYDDPHATPSDVIEELNRIYDQGRWESADLTMWAECVARSNRSRATNARTLISELRVLEGAKVSQRKKAEATPDDDPLDLAREEIIDADTDAMLSGLGEPIEPAMKVLANPKATHTEILKARGTMLDSDLPGFKIDRDFLRDRIVTDRGWLARTKLRWLAENPGIAADLDARTLASRAEKGTISPQDLRLASARAELIRELDLLGWARPGRQFHADSPDLQAWLKQAKKINTRIKRCFGVSVAGKGAERWPTRPMRDLLRAIGVKVVTSKSDGKAIATVKSDPIQRQVIEALSRKWQADHQGEIIPKSSEKMTRQKHEAKIAETPTVQAIDTGTCNPVILKQNWLQVPAQITPETPLSIAPKTHPTQTPIAVPIAAPIAAPIAHQTHPTPNMTAHEITRALLEQARAAWLASFEAVPLG
jgi:hypothetical protein